MISGVTEPLMRVLNAKGISTSVSNRGSLIEIMVKPKDKLEKEKQSTLRFLLFPLHDLVRREKLDDLSFL